MTTLNKIISFKVNSLGNCYGDFIIWNRALLGLTPASTSLESIQSNHNNNQCSTRCLSEDMLTLLGLKETVDTKSFSFNAHDLPLTNSYSIIWGRSLLKNDKYPVCGLRLSGYDNNGIDHGHVLGFKRNSESIDQVLHDFNMKKDPDTRYSGDEKMSAEFADRLTQYMTAWRADEITVQLVWYKPLKTRDKIAAFFNFK
jgi:hypothetical protein